jgi:methylated-DNA-protein-cysteine methyltransferase-like protein
MQRKLARDLEFFSNRAKKSGWANVYSLVKKVPRGRVITYGELARWLRLRGGARTAGRAMSACPRGSGVPWHRVLGSGGRILLREPHSELQRKLLESEGVKFSGAHVEIALHSWKPKRILTAARGSGGRKRRKSSP